MDGLSNCAQVDSMLIHCFCHFRSCGVLLYRSKITEAELGKTPWRSLASVKHIYLLHSLAKAVSFNFCNLTNSLLFAGNTSQRFPKKMWSFLNVCEPFISAIRCSPPTTARSYPSNPPTQYTTMLNPSQMIYCNGWLQWLQWLAMVCCQKERIVVVQKRFAPTLCGGSGSREETENLT